MIIVMNNSKSCNDTKNKNCYHNLLETVPIMCFFRVYWFITYGNKPIKRCCYITLSHRQLFYHYLKK